MMSTRSENERRDHSTRLGDDASERQEDNGERPERDETRQRHVVPRTMTMAMSTNQAVLVMAVRPVRDSSTLPPPRLRPGSLYSPNAHRATSQTGMQQDERQGAQLRIDVERLRSRVPARGRRARRARPTTASREATVRAPRRRPPATLTTRSLNGCARSCPAVPTETCARRPRTAEPLLEGRTVHASTIGSCGGVHDRWITYLLVHQCAPRVRPTVVL